MLLCWSRQKQIPKKGLKSICRTLGFSCVEDHRQRVIKNNFLLRVIIGGAIYDKTIKSQIVYLLRRVGSLTSVHRPIKQENKTNNPTIKSQKYESNSGKHTVIYLYYAQVCTITMYLWEPMNKKLNNLLFQNKFERKQHLVQGYYIILLFKCFDCGLT